MRKKIKTILIDDHQLFRAGMKLVLHKAEDIAVVAEASNGITAFDEIRRTYPDVALVDIKIPGMDGIELSKRILKYHPYLKIIIITVCNNTIYPKLLFEIGVSGYIVKEDCANTVIKAIKAVYSGQKFISEKIAQNIVRNKYDNSTSPFDALNARDLQIMIMLTEGISIDEIAASLNLARRSIISYKNNILNKLDLKNEIELVHLAIQHGIISP